MDNLKERVRAQACTACGAEVGLPCTFADGAEMVDLHHSARIVAAMAAGGESPEVAARARALLDAVKMKGRVAAHRDWPYPEGVKEAADALQAALDEAQAPPEPEPEPEPEVPNCDECGHPPAPGNLVYHHGQSRPLCRTCNPDLKRTVLRRSIVEKVQLLNAMPGGGLEISAEEMFKVDDAERVAAALNPQVVDVSLVLQAKRLLFTLAADVRTLLGLAQNFHDEIPPAWWRGHPKVAKAVNRPWLAEPAKTPEKRVLANGCPSCGKPGYDVTSREDTLHQYVCTNLDCDRKAGTRWASGAVTPFVCPTCTQKFLTSEAATQHANEAHGGVM